MPFPLLIPAAAAVSETVGLSAGAIAAIISGSALTGGSIGGAIVYYFSSNNELKLKYNKYHEQLEPTQKLFSTNQKLAEVLQLVKDNEAVCEKEISAEEKKILAKKLPTIKRLMDSHAQCLKREKTLQEQMKAIPTDYSKWDEEVAKQTLEIQKSIELLQKEVNCVSNQVHDINKLIYKLADKVSSLREKLNNLYAIHQKLTKSNEEKDKALTMAQKSLKSHEAQATDLLQEVQKRNNLLKKMEGSVNKLEKNLQEKDKLLDEKGYHIQEKDTLIQRQSTALKAKDDIIKQQTKVVKDKDEIIGKQNKSLKEMIEHGEGYSRQIKKYQDTLSLFAQARAPKHNTKTKTAPIHSACL